VPNARLHAAFSPVVLYFIRNRQAFLRTSFPKVLALNRSFFANSARAFATWPFLRSIDKAFAPHLFQPAHFPPSVHRRLLSNFHKLSNTMPVSASKAARQAKRAEGDKKKTAASKLASKQSSKNASTNGSEASSINGDETPPLLDEDEEDQPATTSEKMSKVQKLTEQLDRHGLSDRVTTGVLSSLATSRDVKITSVSLVFHGKVLITDTTLELNFGRRYGLLGENGCGKSTLLKAIDKREYPIPEHVDIYLLNEGAAPSDLGALEWVVKEAENEMERLDRLAETILENEGPESPLLLDLYEVSLLQLLGSLGILTTVAYGKHGPIYVPDSSLPHPHWPWLQQKDH
jgi:hypothetical protein